MKLFLAFVLILASEATLAQQFSTKFEYYSQSIELAVSNTTWAPEYAGNPGYLNILNTKGKEGFELVGVERYINYDQSKAAFHHGITLVFKRAISEREKYLQYVVDHVDSVANVYTRKEVARAQADIMAWVSGSKAAYTKEFLDKVNETFTAMLKEYYEKLKQDLLDTINAKKVTNEK